MRSSIPGGLRAQLLLGLSVLLFGSFALGAVLVENVLTRRLLSSREAHLQSIAAVADGGPPGVGETLVAEGVVAALVRGEYGIGAPSVISRLREGGASPYFHADGVQHMRVQHGEVIVAARIDDLRSSVGNARSMLLLFGLLVAVVVLALGYGFFGLIVVRPIRAIGVATERAAQGDLASPISVLPRNEIGRVARSFNEMLRRIEENREELQRTVDETQAANAELAATRDSLIRSEKLASVGQLAAGIAHEIGNPLAALSGYNELLRDGELDPDEARDLLTRSGEQLERIRGVIRNLLDFSRDEQQLDPTATSVQRCVDETVSLVRAGTRAPAIEFEVDDLAGPAVLGVASQIVQILVNLAMNAVDAMPPHGGRIRFRRLDEDGWATLVVEDDGPGIPSDVGHRIFDPFFTTKDPGDGTGLGLAISLRIAESFGGSIDLGVSDLGGARFDLRLRAIGEES